MPLRGPCRTPNEMRLIDDAADPVLSQRPGLPARRPGLLSAGGPFDSVYECGRAGSPPGARQPLLVMTRHAQRPLADTLHKPPRS